MKNSLLQLNGVSNIKDYHFKWTSQDKVDGSIEFFNKDLLGGTISSKILSYKIINSFSEINNDNIEFFNNILVVNIEFTLSIEYSEESNYGKLNLLNQKFYKTSFMSLKNFNFSNLDNEVLVSDFDLLKEEDKLFYYLDIVLGVNEM